MDRCSRQKALSYTDIEAFRVTEILELSFTKDWRWVHRKQNVADFGKKWYRLPQITDSSRWFRGPQFLYQQEFDWPSDGSYERATTEETTQHTFNISSSGRFIDEFRFSNWCRILRVVAYDLRFARNY